MSKFWPIRWIRTAHKLSKIWPNLVDPNCRPNVHDLADSVDPNLSPIDGQICPESDSGQVGSPNVQVLADSLDPNSPQIVQDLAKFGGSQLSTKCPSFGRFVGSEQPANCPRFGQIWWVPTVDRMSTIWPIRWIPTCHQSMDRSVQNRILARSVRQMSKFWPIRWIRTAHKLSKIWPNLVDPNCRPNVHDLADPVDPNL